MLSKRENARRVLRFDNPEYVMTAPRRHRLGNFGVDHDGFDHPDGHACPVGSTWTDIWGTQ